MTVTQASDAPRSKAEKASAANEFVEVVKTIVWALGIALVLRVLLFQPFTIPSASMEPALFEGDYIIVSKWPYGYSRHSIPFSPPVLNGRVAGKSPQRGDIVVFKLPRDDRTDYIKRVIGLPGDRIRVSNDRVYVNGQASTYTVVGAPTREPSCGGIAPPSSVRILTEKLPSGFSHPVQDCFQYDDTQLDAMLLNEVGEPKTYIVPAGHFFMMGDNRDNSVDSRFPEYYGVDMVPAENLVGKAELVLLSWTPEASLFKPWTWVTELRPSRFFTRLK